MDIKQAVEVLKSYSDLYDSLEPELFNSTILEMLEAVNTVIDYIEIDLAVEDLSLEGCSCGDCV